jgi:two-component system phosphate regulon sensor histidine kinase PhoR
MRYSSDPRILSFLTTLTIVGVDAAIFLLFSLLQPQMGMLAFLLGLLTIAVFTYFIIYQALESFIYKKIKLIYKNIHRLKRGKSLNESELRTQVNMIENVNTEVLEWAKMQKEEIQTLKNLEQYRRDFLGNVSHELKTPIFNIQGYIMTLLDGGIYDEKINIKYLEKSADGINRMISMVKDLETISALESGMIEVQHMQFNIIDLAKEVMEYLEEKAKAKNIKLYFAKGHTQVPIFVYADKERIRQVFVNLIVNAIKYIGDTPLPAIKISFYDMHEHILVEVSDNGMGISMQDIPFLFDRFYRVDKARSREQGGTGLGLAIVKHIIEAHKQTINVRSSIGIGTTFSFTLKHKPA